MTKPAKPLKFEQGLEKLEKLIQKMEDGNLALEDSLALYEEGMELAKFCEVKLSEAKAKVEILMKDAAGKKEAIEFEEEEE